MKLSSFRLSRWILFLTSCIATTNVFSQTDSLQLAEVYYEEGLNIYDFAHRKQAKDLFILALQYNPNHAKAHFMAGKSIMLTIDKHNALIHLLRAVELDPNVDEDIFLNIGMAYHYSEDFDNAINYYQLHRKKLVRSLDFERSKQINMVDRKVFECRNARIYKSHPMDVDIENLSEEINSDYPDYAPTVSADQSILVFTSRRDDNISLDMADDHEYYEDVFISKSVNGEFGPAVNMGRPINSTFHNASISISPDGKELFLYNSINGGDIYESRIQEDGTWSKPSPISGEINTEYLENSVSITKDLKTLYFTSNRAGGYGGTDIYVSELQRNKQWGTPKNLGPVVNSEFDEDGVYISTNGNHLYFSSNGHAGMGDLDIYQATLQADNTWSDPINLGYPINSVENDIYFTLSGDEKYAYYSSVKAETHGEQDIYRIDMTNFRPLALEEIIDREEQADPIFKIPDSTLVRLEMTILDGENDNRMNADISITRASDQATFSPVLIDSGNYSFEFYIKDSEKYDVNVAKENFSSYHYPIYVMGAARTSQLLKETITLNKNSLSTVNLINVYFAHDSSVPASFEGAQYLEMMLKNEPNIGVEIGGHTDNTGDPSYNKDLSLRRAESVKQYLIKAGIDAERISTVGYGADKPVADNGSSVGRQLNRRTEFNVKSRLKDTVESEL